MIQAAGGTIRNDTYTSDGTKQTLANNIETTLLAAGWTTISGHATTNLLMQSAATPYPHQMNFRFKAQTNCVVISIESTDGTTVVGGNSTTAGAPLLPTNGKVFRIIANKYQFCIFVDADPSTAREYAFGCVPYVPSFMTGVTNAGLLMGNCAGDGDATFRGSWRTALIPVDDGGHVPNWQAVWGTSIYENANNVGLSNSQTWPMFCEIGCLANPSKVGQTQNTFYNGPIHWANGDFISWDSWISFSINNTAEPLKRFQVWDSIIVAGNFTSGSSPLTTTIAGRACQNLTNNNSGSTTQSIGSLFLFTA